MATENRQSQPALHYEVTAGGDGRIEIVGPFRPGQRLTVLVVPESHDDAYNDAAPDVIVVAMTSDPADAP